LNENTTLSRKKTLESKIESQEPIKIIQAKELIRIIEEYSAKKNKAKPILEYSTLKPETNSLSASGKSKGARFVSANILIRNMRNSGNNGNKKKQNFWVITISMRFNEPTNNRTVIKINPIEIS